MAATGEPSPAIVGHRILGEVEETSLEDVLQRIRAETAARTQLNRTDARLQAAPIGGTTQYGVAPSGRPATAGAGTAGSPVKNSTAAQLRLPNFPIPALQQLVARHFRSTRGPELVVGGQRPLALVYLLVATLIAAPLRQTVVVVDAEARFDVQQLLGVQPIASPIDGSDDSEDTSEVLSYPVTEDDIQHIHVFRVDPRWRVPLAELTAAAEQRVLYGAKRRRDRPWWGTIVIGGAGGGGATGNLSSTADNNAINSTNTLSNGVGAALTTGSFGWLRVNQQEKDIFQTHKDRHQQLIALFEDVNLDDHNENQPTKEKETKETSQFEPVSWVASSPWGSFTFRLAYLVAEQVHIDEPNVPS